MFEHSENLFKWGFSGIIKDSESGKCHVTVEEPNHIALEMILKIAHVRIKDIPGKLESLEMPVQVAVIAEYYQMKESIGLFAVVWIAESSKQLLPLGYCKRTVI
jgi:hypothetical protein